MDPLIHGIGDWNQMFFPHILILGLKYIIKLIYTLSITING